jgi:C1A family cysteine protease
MKFYRIMIYCLSYIFKSYCPFPNHYSVVFSPNLNFESFLKRDKLPVFLITNFLNMTDREIKGSTAPVNIPLWPDETHGFGLERTPDEKYNAFASIELAAPAAFPPRVDLSWKMSPIKNQSIYSACVGFAVAAALEIVPNVVGISQDEAERFIWFNSKARDGIHNPDSDRGTYIHTAIAVAQQLGSCWEGQCPFSTGPLLRPSPEAYAAAANMKVTEAYRLVGNGIEHYKAMLSIGWPVIVGFDIFGDRAYQEYISGEYTRRTGIMKMPPEPVPARTNGHAVVFVGYDDNSRLFKFKNSWGPLGDRGYYYMPYDYVKYTSDAWVLWGQNIRLPVIAQGVTAMVVGAAGDKNVENVKINAGVQPQDVSNEEALASELKK